MELGHATLTYDESGKVINAQFEPTMKVEVKDDLLQEFKTISVSDSADEVKHNAELALASWFSKTTEIELSDRDKYDITSEVVSCDKFPTGMIKQCVIKFFYGVRAR